MAKTMIASQKPMTDGQVNALVAKFRDALIKHRKEITAQVAQQVLGLENLGMEFYSVVRKHVRDVPAVFFRGVTVDLSLTAQQVLDATGRRQYSTHKSVVATMPRGQAREIVFFFRLNRYVNDDELEGEYAVRNLKPASPYSLARVNEDDPAFASIHPNSTHWKDADGSWCYATFDQWDDKYLVSVNRNGRGWDRRWWLAGVRK